MTPELTPFAPFVKGERSWRGQGPQGPVLVKWGEYESVNRQDCPRVLAAGGPPPFLVRELHSGPSLLETAPLTTEQAVELFARVLSALQRLHQDGVVHGRLKPSNIFDGGLTDCGLMVPETDPFALLFRAPELNGTVPAAVGPTADLYSAGAVLYFMLVGRPPFTAVNLSQALRAPFLQPIPSLAPSGEDPALRLGLEAMMIRLMNIDAQARYVSAAEALADLARLRNCPSGFVAGTGERRQRLASPGLVGRSDLLASLRRQLGRGGLFQLVGEAGSGKTRLTQEISRTACARGCRSIRRPESHGDGIVRLVKECDSNTSALTIPLPLSQSLYCDAPGLPEYFGSEELRLAGLIQGQARAALTNAHLWTELREREAHLEQLFTSVPAGIAVIDGSGVVLQSNPRLVKMLGRCPLGSELGELLQTDDRPWFDQALRRLDDAGTLQRELRLELPEGRLLWGEMSLRRLPGAEGRAIVALADVSLRRLEQVAAFQERERSMVSAEVHDVLSQPLVALHLGLEALARQHPQAEDAMRSAAQTARDTLSATRGLIARLRSPQLESLGQSIDEAVEDLVDRSRVEVGVELDPALNGLPPLPTLFIYRIVVEALTNFGRHARGGRLRLRLRLRQDEIRGVVADDGVGFAPDLVASQRFGLRIVRERAELLGGRAKIRSAPGRGTAILFQFPVVPSGQ